MFQHTHRRARTHTHATATMTTTSNTTTPGAAAATTTNIDSGLRNYIEKTKYEHMTVDPQYPEAGCCNVSLYTGGHKC